MAGLSVLLETQKNDFPKYTQIIRQTSLHRNSSLSPSSSSSGSTAVMSTFLESCYYCRKRLQEGRDIYMYRGDRAFCSEECRCRQIFMDEESERRDYCSLVAAAVTADGGSRAMAGRRRAWRVTGEGRAVAGGGFAY